MKTVQVNTPLILEDSEGQVRHEAGSIITLDEAVYAEVSAHVSVLDESITDTQAMADEEAVGTDESADVSKPPRKRQSTKTEV